MSEPKNFYCPECGSKVGRWDGKSSINVISRCNKCRKRIVYHIDTGETEIKPIPSRSTGSGLVLS